MWHTLSMYPAVFLSASSVPSQCIVPCETCPENEFGLLGQVRAEVTYQARRLDSHPSLAIWGGGNEVEASFRWFPDSRDDPQSFTDDYMQVCLPHMYGFLTSRSLSGFSATATINDQAQLCCTLQSAT